MTQKQEIETRVRDVLEQLRPYLLEDGGDLELVEITDDLVAKIELKGNCSDCSLNSMTFRTSIEESILRSVPEVTKIEAINFTLRKPEF
jgi:Fe-S cluster biogenesis protein NfuA